VGAHGKEISSDSHTIVWRGKDAGRRLGGGLTNWRKIVVGDREWRIIFTMDPDERLATVWVIGDRADAECYAEAQRRVENLAGTHIEAATLAAVMFQLVQAQRAARRSKRRR
jgi:mRNA interferase RelE/StbE